MIRKHSSHPSIATCKLRETTVVADTIKFHKDSVEDIKARLKRLNLKKSASYHTISPKFLESGANMVCYPIQKCIEMRLFSTALKKAEITPLHKKDDILLQENYRSVSILACIPNIFEGVLVDQLPWHFQNVLSPYVSGFRKGHDCQSVLVRFTESIKHHLDNKEVAGALLTDLSKAFNSLSHDLLCKMHTYSLSNSACKLIGSYFKDRYHRAKMGTTLSHWLRLTKGTPNGSVMGPFANTM